MRAGEKALKFHVFLSALIIAVAGSCAALEPAVSGPGLLADQSRASSSSSSSSSSSAAAPGETSSSPPSPSSSSSPPSAPPAPPSTTSQNFVNGPAEVVRNGADLTLPGGNAAGGRWYKPELIFVPKFKERLLNLADQIKLVQSKGFITAEEASSFLSRQAALLAQESEAARKGFPRAEVDALEKGVTLLNSDLFKASRKSDPVKPGAAETEVNDPNLIPAYPDPELQPGSKKP